MDILNTGFKDAGTHYRGVWVADVPVDVPGGAKDDYVVVFDIPDEVLSQFLFTDNPRDYSVFVVPAEVLNQYEIKGCFCMNDEDYVIDQMSEPNEISIDGLDFAVTRAAVVQCAMLSNKLRYVIESNAPAATERASIKGAASKLSEDLNALVARLDALLD